MIDNKYRINYMYEIEIEIYYKNNNSEKIGYKIWRGYFENLLDGCYGENIAEDGILHGYMLQEEWYDEKPWEIRNIDTAILELERYNKNNVKSGDDILDKLEDLKKELIKLLKEAKENNHSVYIEYD